MEEEVAPEKEEIVRKVIPVEEKAEEVAKPPVIEEAQPEEPVVEERPEAVQEEEARPEPEDKTAILRDREQLKTVMEAASLNMIKLEDALRAKNWEATSQSAKRLEELIGRYCIDLYIRMNPAVPDEFIIISNRFFDSMFKILFAKIENDFDAAWKLYMKMHADCNECHIKFRKEGGTTSPPRE